MNVEQALLAGQQRLTSQAPDTVADTVSSTHAWIEVEMLLSHVLGCERTWLIAHADAMLSASQEKRFFKLIDRRKQQEPLAYLIGWKEFCGLRFHVNRHVLIPRPETEEMVERASLLLRRRESRPVIWDVGTGSGAIAISLKKRCPQTYILASDVSRRALRVAMQNAKDLLGSNHDVHFLQGSLLSKTIQTQILSQKPERLFVLANLPYLPLLDRQTLEKSVVDFEPHQALFTADNGNALIEKLLLQLKRFAIKYGIYLNAWLEFDLPQADTLKQKAKEIFPEADVFIHEDTCGRARFLEIKT